MAPVNKYVLWSGIAGLGLVALGGLLYWRERRMALPGGVSGFGRSREAPVIGSYSDGNWTSTMRQSQDMPIEERLASIQALIEKSVQDGEMRKLALSITSRCPERDQVCEAKAIYDAVKSRVRYTGDVGPIRHADGTVEGIDLYQSARRTWEMRGGDCDDQSILNATLLALNGIEPILRVVRQKQDNDWSHIYAAARINGRVLALDSTLPGKDKFGVELPIAKHIDFPA